jgi:hypothetical protein
MKNSIQIGLLVLAAAFLLGCQVRPRTENDVRRTLERQFPLGTQKEYIRESLNKQNVLNSDCKLSDGNCLLAKISGGNQELNIVRTDFGIDFRFNAQNQLVAIKVKPHYTGP